MNLIKIFKKNNDNGKKNASPKLSLSSSIYCIIFLGKLLLFILLEPIPSFWNTGLGTPPTKDHNESSCCYYILRGISKKQILGSKSDHSQGNDGFS